MEKLEDIEQAIIYMKAGAILTTSRYDEFLMEKGKIRRRFDGSSVLMRLEDFIDLFQNLPFYVLKDDENEIDEKKDEEYYRYYKK